TIVPQDAGIVPLMNAQRAAAISAAPTFGVPLTATPAAAPATTVAADTPTATPPVVPVSALSPPMPIAPAPMAPLQPATSAPTPWVVPLVNTNNPAGSDTTALDMVFSEPWSTNALGNTDVVDQVFAVPLQ
ncbi:MAG TPA: hypothetical protein VNX28_02780, partial [Gemmataceae bacterium]|nr:hypothetical protein [Gemmataceae bacterium]